MAGASIEHNRICFNVAGELHRQLKNTSCSGFTSDQKARSDLLDLFSSPDITVVCGEPQFHDEHRDVILNPTVIIEVLSPATGSSDRGEKFARYRQTKSLTDYILIAQDRVSVEHYLRQKGNRAWLFTEEMETDAEIVIASIKCRLKVADIYNRVVFPTCKSRLIEITERQMVMRPKRRK
jgi:Uma2 family endonuclease